MKTLALAVLLAVLYATNSMHISHQADAQPINFCLSIGNTLYGGQSLEGGQCLRSENGLFDAKMQKDGNFVLFKGPRVVWETYTSSRGVAPWRLTLQTDGNVLLYDSKNKHKWETITSNPRESTRYRLVMQNDGDLVLFTPEGRAIWTSNSKAKAAES